MDLTLIVSRPPALRWDREWHSLELRLHKGASPATLALELHFRLRPPRVTVVRREPRASFLEQPRRREWTWPATSWPA